MPFRFYPCMVAGLAYYLAMKKNPNLVSQNKMIYEDELKRDFLLFILGGKERFNMLIDMYNFLSEKGVNVFIVTNNDTAEGESKLWFLSIINLIFSDFRENQLIYSGVIGKYEAINRIFNCKRNKIEWIYRRCFLCRMPMRVGDYWQGRGRVKKACAEMAEKATIVRTGSCIGRSSPGRWWQWGCRVDLVPRRGDETRDQKVYANDRRRGSRMNFMI